jgi:hypothetical protein
MKVIIITSISLTKHNKMSQKTFLDATEKYLLLTYPSNQGVWGRFMNRS